MSGTKCWIGDFWVGRAPSAPEGWLLDGGPPRTVAQTIRVPAHRRIATPPTEGVCAPNWRVDGLEGWSGECRLRGGGWMLDDWRRPRRGRRLMGGGGATRSRGGWLALTRCARQA